MPELKIYVLCRDCRLSEIAVERGMKESELKRLNGLERRGALPRGMSLVLPGEDGRSRREKELYFTAAKTAAQCPGRLSFLSAEFGAEAESGAEADAAFPDFASSRGALGVYSLCARGDTAETRELISETERSRAYLEALTEKLAALGYGGLMLDFPRLLPFDREHFTDFAACGAESAHKRGLWLVCALPLHEEADRYQRNNAAYDAAALGARADRLVLEAGRLMGTEEMGRGLEYMCSLVPAGRLLAGVCEGARLQRADELERISARSAQNLAMTAMAEINRRGAGEPAEFCFRDKAGALCRVEYGDALWAERVCELIERLSLAGLARRSAQGLCCGTERVFEEYFAPQELF